MLFIYLINGRGGIESRYSSSRAHDLGQGATCPVTTQMLHTTIVQSFSFFGLGNIGICDEFLEFQNLFFLDKHDSRIYFGILYMHGIYLF